MKENYSFNLLYKKLRGENYYNLSVIFRFLKNTDNCLLFFPEHVLILLWISLQQISCARTPESTYIAKESRNLFEMKLRYIKI